MGSITTEERAAVRSRSPIGFKYDTAVNRESAYEILNRRASQAEPPVSQPVPQSPRSSTRPAPPAAPAPPASDTHSKVNDYLWGTSRRQGMVETMAKQAARTVGSQLGRQILRGVLGGLLGGARRK
jgi:hypothetical protein